MHDPIRLYLDEDTIQLQVGVIVRRLLKLLAARSAGDMRDWLEYLSNWR